MNRRGLFKALLASIAAIAMPARAREPIYMGNPGRSTTIDYGFYDGSWVEVTGVQYAGVTIEVERVHFRECWARVGRRLWMVSKEEPFIVDATDVIEARIDEYGRFILSKV
jgi:hypothetical protein